MIYNKIIETSKQKTKQEEMDMKNKVIGKIDLGAFSEYNDPDSWEIKDGCAIIDYGFKAGAYEDIFLNLGGELQANAFLKYTEENNHGTFIGDGYVVEF